MILTPNQTQTLLSVIERNQSLLIAQQLGVDFLSLYDRSLLESSGVDWKSLYSEENDSIFNSFNLGMLAVALSDTKAMDKFSYKDLHEYIRGGKYIPLSGQERETIQAIKNSTFAGIKKQGGKIFQDLNNILHNHTQEDFLKDRLVEGSENKKSFTEIAHEINRLTGDWNRDFSKIVDFESNGAYQAGRAAMIEKDEEDPLVYKRVFEQSCNHCSKFYLTKGFGSEPIIYKLSELRANGSNVGRKVDEWKPTIPSIHPHCRCLLHKKPKGYKWNPKTQAFDIVDKETPILKKPRKPIHIQIGEQKLTV